MAESTNILDLIRTQVGVVQKQITDTTTTSIENAKRAEAAASEAQKTYEQVGKDKALIETQVGLDKLRIEQANRQAATAAGITDGGGNRLLDLIGNFQRVSSEALITLQTVRKKEETQFLDSPIEYIKNQFTVDADKEKLAGAVKELDLTDALINKTATQLGHAYKDNAARTNSVTQATIESSARVAASEAEIRAQQAKIDGLKYNSEAVAAAQKGGVEQLSVLYNQRNAQMSEQQHKLALAEFAARQEQRTFEHQMRQDALEAKNVGKMLDEVTLGKINTARIGLGLQPFTGLEAKVQLEMYRKGNAPQMQEWYNMGERMQATGVTSYGAKPSQALDMLYDPTKTNNLPELVANTAKFLNKLREDPAVVNALKLVDPKDTKKRSDIIDAHIDNQMKSIFSNIVPGSGNPLDVGDVSQYFGTGRLQNLRFVKEILEPAKAAGTPLNDPATVMSLGMAAASKGLLTTSEVAAGIAATYQRANIVNQATRNFAGFGIILPSDGYGYNAQVGGWGNTLDLTSYTAVGTYINHELASKADNPFGPSAYGIRQAEKEFSKVVR